MERNKEEKKIRTCCICGIELGPSEHNNPTPVEQEGECCNMCAYEIVIPARCRKFFRDEK